MSADWNTSPGHLRDESGEGAIYFDLDRIGRSFGEEPTGIANALGLIALVRHKGHITHDECLGGATFDSGGEHQQ